MSELPPDSSAHQHRDNFDFYPRPIDGKPASVFVDLAWREHIPDDPDSVDPARPTLLIIQVALQHPSPDGLPTQQEFQHLAMIEDTLVGPLEQLLDAVYVGRITTDGRRDFFFYAPSDEGFDEAVTRLRSAFGSSPARIGRALDPTWRFYRETLFPDADGLRHIADRKIIRQLQSLGDDEISPREITHFCYFPAIEQRAGFIARASQKGFLTEPFEASEPDVPLPCGLKLSRNDRADARHISAVTVALLNLAREFDGEYDGWESPVVGGQSS